MVARNKTFTKLAFLLFFSVIFAGFQVSAAKKNIFKDFFFGSSILSSKDFQISNDGSLEQYSGSSENVVVPSGVKSISFGAFMDHTEIKSISLPAGLESVDECAFYGCTGLKNIHLPESVESVERLAFGGCTSLEKIYMGKNLKNLAELFACDCPNLCEFEVSAKNKSFKVVDGILYSKDMKNLILCPQNASGTVSIPDEVVTIKEQSFFECENIKEVNIGKNVKYIDEAAFYGCKNLKKVNMSDSVKKIRSYAFSECSSLEDFYVGESVTYIGNGAFYNCNSLSKVTCLNKNIELGADIFTHGANVILYVSGGSDAYEYAVNNKYNFQIM